MIDPGEGAPPHDEQRAAKYELTNNRYASWCAGLNRLVDGYDPNQAVPSLKIYDSSDYLGFEGIDSGYLQELVKYGIGQLAQEAITKGIAGPIGTYESEEIFTQYLHIGNEKDKLVPLKLAYNKPTPTSSIEAAELYSIRVLSPQKFTEELEWQEDQKEERLIKQLTQRLQSLLAEGDGIMQLPPMPDASADELAEMVKLILVLRDPNVNLMATYGHDELGLVPEDSTTGTVQLEPADHIIPNWLLHANSDHAVHGLTDKSRSEWLEALLSVTGWWRAITQRMAPEKNEPYPLKQAYKQSFLNDCAAEGLSIAQVAHRMDGQISTIEKYMAHNAKRRRIFNMGKSAVYGALAGVGLEAGIIAAGTKIAKDTEALTTNSLKAVGIFAAVVGLVAVGVYYVDTTASKGVFEKAAASSEALTSNTAPHSLEGLCVGFDDKLDKLQATATDVYEDTKIVKYGFLPKRRRRGDTSV